MEIIQTILDRLQAITTWMNSVIQNSKKIDELPVQNSLTSNLKIMVSDSGIAKQLALSLLGNNIKPQWFRFGNIIPGTTEITASEVSNWINLQPWQFVVYSNRGPIIFEFTRIVNGINKRFLFMFNRGEGMWGKANGTITDIGKWAYPSSFDFFISAPLTPIDLDTNPSAIIHPLGLVEDGNYVAKANLSTWDLTDSGTVTPEGTKSYYFSYQYDNGDGNGVVLYYALFKGSPGMYGIEGDQPFTPDDFYDNYTNTTVQPTPNIHNVLTAGNATALWIRFKDTLTRLTQIGPSGLWRTKGLGIAARTTKVGFEDPTENNDILFPNKSGVVAMIGDINGLTLYADQPSSMIYLRDALGNNITSLNVGFLNNEGTTFFYNSTTGNLELKDDLGNVLSVVPVSAFVTNLIHSVAFNGATPYIQEFKDSAGAIISSVSFGINNIQGLLAALNGKLSLDVAGTSNDYYDGVGTLKNFETSTQNSTIGADNGSDSVVTVAADSVRKGIWNLIRQSVSKLNIDQVIDGVKSWVKGNIFTYGGATGTNVHVRKLTEMFSYVNSQPTVSGSIQIRLPIAVAQNNMWQMTVQILEYQAATGTKPATELIITGYTDTNSHATVTTVNPSTITQVRWGRNVANDKTIVIIDGSGTWTYPKVIIKEIIWHHSSNGTVLTNPANYGLTISTDETDYVPQIARTSAQFSRDQYPLNASNLNAGTIPYARLPFTSTDQTNWSSSVPTSHGNTKASVVYGAGGESMNSLPKGTYTAAVSTLATDKPFTQVGALISVGDLSNGYQILGSRSGTEFWFRPYSTTYGTWIKMYSSIDVNGLYMPLGTNIPTASNLDTYQSTGHFNCISNTIAAAGTNFPSPVAGTLTVVQSANALVYQRYHTAGGSENNVYVRVLAGGSWTAWRKLWHDGNLPTSLLSNNWDTITVSGTYYNNSTSATGIPQASSLMTVQHIESGGNASQIAIQTASPRDAWVRGRVGGVWGNWARLWNSSHFSSTNVSNWNTAFGWGDFRNFGLGRTTLLAPAADDIDNPDLPSGIWSVGDTFGSPLLDSFGAVLQMRGGMGGDSVAQICVKADASGNNEFYIRSCDDEGFWTDWARAWTSEDFDQSDIDSWNNNDFTALGWGEGIEVNPLFTGNVISIGDARVVRVDSTTATNLPSGVGDGVLVALAGKPTYGDSLYTFHDVNGDFYVGRQGGMSMVWKKVSFVDDIYTTMGATHGNSTMPTLTYMNSNFPSAPDGFEYRCPLTTPPAVIKKCADGTWLTSAWTVLT